MKTHNLVFNLCNQFKSVKSVEGSALMITAVVVMAMVVVSGVFLADVVNHTRMVDSYEQNYQLRYAADSGLEQVKYQVQSNSTWLANNSSTTGFLAFNDLAIGNALVDVTVTDLTNNRYSVVSVAQINQPYPVTYSLVMEIRFEGPLFPNGYAVASDKGHLLFLPGDLERLTVAGPRVFVNGNIRTNDSTNLGANGANAYVRGCDNADQPRIMAEFNGNLTLAGELAVWDGIYSIPNTPILPSSVASISGVLQENVASDFPYSFPNLNYLYTAADNVYRISTSNPLYTDTLGTRTQIQIQGDSIRIISTGNTVNWTPANLDITLPLPANGLLYLTDVPAMSYWDEGGDLIKNGGSNQSIYFKGGMLNGRLTVVSPERVWLYGDMKYVDNEGDPAFLLKENGVVVSDTAKGVIWNAQNNVTYTANPDYNPTVSSSFGLIAPQVDFTAAPVIGYDRNNATYANYSAPWGGNYNYHQDYNREWHGAIWTQNMYFGYSQGGGATLMTSSDYCNFALYGSIVSGYVPPLSPANMGGGYRGTAHFNYDAGLDTNPPPFFNQRVAVFTGWRRG